MNNLENFRTEWKASAADEKSWQMALAWRDFDKLKIPPIEQLKFSVKNVLKI